MYEIADDIPPPPLPGSAYVAPDADELHHHMSSDLLAHSLNCGRAFSDFHMALSGGDAMVSFYRQLMIDPVCRGIPWKKTHIWCTCETASDAFAPDSTWSSIDGFFGNHSGVPRTQQHPIPTHTRSPARRYEGELRSVLEWRERGQDRLDYVLLELQPDGSIAGLVPFCDAIYDTKRLLMTAGDPPVTTMTLSLINSARLIGVIATGKDVRPVIERIIAGDGSVASIPARGLDPVGGTLMWYLDREACPDSEDLARDTSA